MPEDTILRRKVLRAAGATAVGGLVATTGSAAGSRRSTSVRLLHDTHFHGRFENAFADDLNVANYFGLMNEIQGVTSGFGSGSGNVLRVGNGDDLASSVLSAVFEGRHIVSAFNAGGLDYDTFGNHDFDMGPDVLRTRVSESRFTWVSANVREEGEVFAADAGAQPYGLWDVDGVTIGVTGLITPEAPLITSVGENTDVLDPAPAMREVIPQMREDGADAVVVLSHLAGPTAERVARSVGGIDAIVGDHAARVLEEPLVVNDTVLSFVGDQFEYIGELGLTVSPPDGVTGHRFALHGVGAEADSTDPWVGLLKAHFEGQLDERLETVIGQTTVPLDTRETVVRRRESNVGNYVADSLRNSADADVGLMNGGGIRTGTRYFEDASEDAPADITQKLVVNVLPFPNNVVGLELSGSTLMTALENGVSRVEELSGRFPQVSNITYTYDPSQPAGNRIVEATVGGESIDSDASYSLATNDFVSGGGDGYSMLADASVYLPGNEGALLSDLLINRISEAGTISPTTEGRITRRESGG